MNSIPYNAESQQYVWRKDISSSHQNEFVVGIDFGTTNSCVAIWNPYKKRAKVIKNLNSKRLTRSNIKFDQDFENPQIGVTEINELYSTQVLSRIKLLLGSTGTSDTIICQNMLNEKYDMSVEKLCSFILKYIKNYAEVYILKNMKQLQGFSQLSSSSSNSSSSVAISQHSNQRHLPLKAVVIGIPVSFTTNQVNALHKAANMAGFEKVYFMSESTAAAMSYGLLVAGTKTVIIFDMGGGTTDVTILHISDGTSKVLATAGNGQCGGSNMDMKIIQHVIKTIASTYFSAQEIEKWEKNINIFDSIQKGNSILFGHLMAICSDAKVLT